MRYGCVLLLGAALLRTGAPTTVAVARQIETPDWAQVAEGLYVYAGEGGNVAARVTTTGVVLVDTTTAVDFERLLMRLDDIGAPPISHIVNTHHHPDHTGGNHLATGRPRLIARASARTNMMDAGVAAVPDLVFTSELAILAGGAEIRVRAVDGGHTDGDAVVLFPDLGVIHTGDLLVGGPPFVDYGHGGRVEGWMTALGEILSLEFELAIPGHGPVMTRAEVQRFRDALLTLRARLAQLIENGVPKDEIVGTLVTDDLGWPLDLDGSVRDAEPARALRRARGRAPRWTLGDDELVGEQQVAGGRP